MDASDRIQRLRTRTEYSNVISQETYRRLLRYKALPRTGVSGPVPDSFEITMRRGELSVTPAEKAAIIAQAEREAGVIPSPGPRWIQIANYTNHSAALRIDGTLWTWGLNFNGQLGINSTIGTATPTQIPGAWSAITAGNNTTYAIKQDQTLWAWGSNFTGELGVGDLVNKLVPTQVPGSWKAISSQNITPFGIKADGTLWAWGDNTYGQFGDGNTDPAGIYPNPIQIGSATNWVSVAAQSISGAAINDLGELWMWGENGNGECGQGDIVTPKAICQIPGIWKYVTCGFSHTIAQKTDDTWWCWGGGAYGQLGLGDNIPILTPTPFAVGTWSSVFASGSSTFAITPSGEMFACGWNLEGQLSLGNTVLSYNTLQPISRRWQRAITGGPSEGRTTAIGIDGRISITGRVLESYSRPQILTPSIIWTLFICGSAHVAALRDDGTIWTWGNNEFGQLGQGDIDTRRTPTQMGSDLWSYVYAGRRFTMARKSDNTLLAWGTNTAGQYGDGTTTDSLTPIPVQTNVLDAALGMDFTLIIKDLGGFRTIYSAGSNATGQLGRIGVDELFDSVVVGTASINIDTISAGAGCSFAIREDGTLWAWGVNSIGQLGLGDVTDRNIPTQVGSDTNWLLVYAGKTNDTNRSTTAAIKTDGSLWIWGLLPGTNTTVNIPTQISGIWASVVIGNQFIVAQKTNGTLWSWGVNSSGQLGLGDFFPRTSPTQIITSTNFTTIQCGFSHMIAKDTAGHIWAWGNNTLYQLGLLPITEFTLVTNQ